MKNDDPRYLKTVVALWKHPILKKSWIQNVEDKIGWKKLTYLVLSVKPAKDSTYQGWFVEYGAVAAPLPVCHPIMLASLSFLHLKTSTYDLQIRSQVSLWEWTSFNDKWVSPDTWNVTLSHLDGYDLITLVIVTIVNINSDKITSINYKIYT